MRKPAVTTHKLIFDTFSLNIVDYATSSTPQIVRKELIKNRYNIDSIKFSPNDVVIDIGAHVGIVSVYVAKKYPFVKIYAFEPIPDNYEHLTTNLRLNNVNNVIPHNLAVTSDGREFDMLVNFADNSGGATGHLRDMRLSDHFSYTVESVPFDSVFDNYSITVCKLLKIDCEGTEHEILTRTRYLSRIEYLSGEFHINQHLAEQGYSIETLITHCRKLIPERKMKIKPIRMAE
jgi:FkbM family methyltransferase